LPLRRLDKFAWPLFLDFNDNGKLGSGKEMAERLSNLIAIFEN